MENKDRYLTVEMLTVISEDRLSLKWLPRSQFIDWITLVGGLYALLRLIFKIVSTKLVSPRSCVSFSVSSILKPLVKSMNWD